MLYFLYVWFDRIWLFLGVVVVCVVCVLSSAVVSFVEGLVVDVLVVFGVCVVVVTFVVFFACVVFVDVYVLCML